MKHTHFALPAIALLALTLAACGSPTTAAVPPTAAPATTVAPTATIAPASATSVPATTTPAATATEQPTDMPVATDEPVTEGENEVVGLPAGFDKAALCDLLTVDEVEQVLGKLEIAPESESSTQNGVPVCSYVTEDVLMGIGVVSGDVDALQAQVDRYTQQGAPLEVVPGLGDTAYVAAATMPNASNDEIVIGLLMVLKNKTILSINLLGGTDVVTTHDALLKLAQLAVERLP